MKSKQFIFAVTAVMVCSACGFGSVLSDFDDLALDSESYWKGSDGSGSFTSGGASFSNSYDTQYGSWSGFAYSNRTDASATGYADAQYISASGTAQSGSNYAIGYVWAVPTITLNSAGVVDGLYMTNGLHTKNIIVDGDALWGSAALGVDDWYKVIVTGKDALGDVTNTKDVYLADFRDGEAFVSTDWMYVDLSGLGVVSSLEFTVAGSDMGDWGLNTPGYFAIDTVVPEPVSIMLLGAGFMFIRRRQNSR